MKISQYVCVCRYTLSCCMWCSASVCVYSIYARTSECVVKSYSVSVFKDLERQCKLICLHTCLCTCCLTAFVKKDTLHESGEPLPLYMPDMNAFRTKHDSRVHANSTTNIELSSWRFQLTFENYARQLGSFPHKSG